MNEKKLFNAITDIDDKLIEDAKTNNGPRVKRKKLYQI